MAHFCDVKKYRNVASLLRWACLVLCIFVLTAHFPQSTYAQQRGVSQPWSERGVFFFDGVVFDFWRSIQSYGLLNVPLSNCSDDKFFCAESLDFHIVLPRQCGVVKTATVGDNWSNGKVSLTIFRITKSPPVAGRLHAFGSGTIMLLGNSSYPHVVYEYDPGMGIYAFYYDASRKVDFLSHIKSDSLPQFRTRLYYFGIAAVDAFGLCK